MPREIQPMVLFDGRSDSPVAFKRPARPAESAAPASDDTDAPVDAPDAEIATTPPAKGNIGRA